MKMFSKAQEAMRMLYLDEELVNVENAVSAMKVKSVGTYSAFFEKDEGGCRGKKVGFDKVDELCRCLKSTSEGIEALDMMMEDIKWLRARLAKSIISMRNAYRNKCASQEIAKIAEMKDAKKDDPVLRGLLADILGWKSLPDEMVDVSVVGITMDNYVGVYFSVSGKPTSAVIAIPLEVDFVKDYRMCKDTEELMNVGKDWIQGIAEVGIRMAVSSGVCSSAEMYETDVKNDVEATYPTLEALAENVKKVLDMDVRDKLRKIEDISEVKDVDDFIHWRARRSANASANRHGVEE